MHRYAEVLSERLRDRVLRGIAGLCALQRQAQLAGDPFRHYDYHRAKQPDQNENSARSTDHRHRRRHCHQVAHATQP